MLTDLAFGYEMQPQNMNSSTLCPAWSALSCLLLGLLRSASFSASLSDPPPLRSMMRSLRFLDGKLLRRVLPP